MTTDSGATRWNGHPALTVSKALLKGAMDRLIALLALLVLAPLLLVVVVAVRYEGKPVFVRQERVGAHGQRFRTVSFRSSGERVGPVLRRHSLVDLPQLLNVAGGSMSLVGPRPRLVAEAGATPFDDRPVPAVKPGLTGLGQAGAPGDSWDDVACLELRYVREWTPALDARILARSLRTALHDDRAA